VSGYLLGSQGSVLEKGRGFGQLLSQQSFRIVCIIFVMSVYLPTYNKDRMSEWFLIKVDMVGINSLLTHPISA
jgi:hypothetical protein